ncbi:hypothetical protein ABZ714_14320 [Streptomyces sp. NPDC006798]|uniref:hypothetical protein n=1 Tax=unclassified Streptomyces TaxID=2593676 RepID=UPI0033D7318B
MTYYVRIEYGNEKAIEAEGETLEQLVDSANLGIKILWGSKKFGQNAVTLDEMDTWLGQSMRATVKIHEPSED